MTHDEARELLELAAAEPGGLDRLAAGDTADAGALAGHLADCDGCREEYARLTRTARLLRASLVAMPPPELRERTLARIAAEGRVRQPVSVPALETGPTAAFEGGVSAGARDPDAVVLRPAVLGGGSGWRSSIGRVLRGDPRFVTGWIGSLAAAVVLAVGLSWVVVARPLADQLSAQREAANGFAHLTSAIVALDTRPDARHVALTSATGASGSLAFSASARELVVVSTDLPIPEPGAEYRCWVEQDGVRTQLGRMYRLSDVLAWEGEADAIGAVQPGAIFGVSLVRPGSADGETVLTGTVSGT